jgi:hypothetical protein
MTAAALQAERIASTFFSAWKWWDDKNELYLNRLFEEIMVQVRYCKATQRQDGEKSADTTLAGTNS